MTCSVPGWANGARSYKVIGRFIFPLFLLAAAGGCGSQNRAGQQPERAHEEAVKAMGAQDYAAANDAWTRAIEGGGLAPDQYGDALINRAMCRAILSEFEGARQDLDTAAQGVPDMDRVYAAEAFLLAKEGKKAEADAKMQEARRLNPQVKPFDL